MPSLFPASSRVLLTPPYTLKGHVPILLAPRDGSHTRGCRGAGSGPATSVLSHMWLCGLLMAMALPFISLQKLEPARAERARLVERLGWVRSALCKSSLCHPLNLRKDTGNTVPPPPHPAGEDTEALGRSKWQSHHSDPGSPGSSHRCEWQPSACSPPQRGPAGGPAAKGHQAESLEGRDSGSSSLPLGGLLALSKRQA